MFRLLVLAKIVPISISLPAAKTTAEPVIRVERLEVVLESLHPIERSAALLALIVDRQMILEVVILSGPVVARLRPTDQALEAAVHLEAMTSGGERLGFVRWIDPRGRGRSDCDQRILDGSDDFCSGVLRRFIRRVACGRISADVLVGW